MNVFYTLYLAISTRQSAGGEIRIRHDAQSADIIGTSGTRHQNQ